jgi:hypothetical protein
VSLGSCFPRPRRVELQGATYLAREFKLRHMARIDSWIQENLPDPFAELDDPDPIARREKLKSAYEHATSPPGMGSPEGDALFYGTIEGRELFLRLVLRESRLTRVNARALSVLLEPDEWHALEMIAYASDPWSEVVSSIDRELEIAPFTPACDDEGISWEEAIAQTSIEWKKSVAEIGDWYLSQWRTVRSGGKNDDRSEPIPADPAAADKVQKRRFEFWNGPGRDKTVEDNESPSPTQLACESA